MSYHCYILVQSHCLAPGLCHTHCLTSVDGPPTNRFKGLGPEDMLVYQHIQQAGNMGDPPITHLRALAYF